MLDRPVSTGFSDGNGREQLPRTDPASRYETHLESRSETHAPSLSSFDRLPRSVIEHILYVVDPNLFASLALLNRKWRRISDSSSLYSHHLSRCPSFYLTRNISEQIGLQDLYYLKRRFFSEIRRNAFDVFLRPRRTLVKLISASINSSTAFPQGEAFRFFFSPNGHIVLCMSSARVIVLDVTSDPLIRHEFKTSRRPLSATILDSGRVLAVVSSSHQINIYNLSDEEAKHVQVLELNDVPRALALSPTGSVLAVAYSNGIEVYSLGEMVSSSAPRAVQCARVDSILFSSDETIILGSSVECGHNNTVTITAPLNTDDGLPPEETQGRLWATQVLFPSTIQGHSHASLVPLNAADDSSWVLGYDSRVAAFGTTKVNNANSGAIYFASPASDGMPQDPLPFIPAVDDKGELVALGFKECGVWLYGIPASLDIAPSFLESHVDEAFQPARLLPALRNSSIELQQGISQPKVFVSGHKMFDMPGITAACWVRQTQPARRRLVAVAPGGIDLPTIGEAGVPVDSGRVLVLDFERSPKNGETSEIKIEIGDAEPKTLKEPNSSIDTEIELERRRTRLHRDNNLVNTTRVAYRPATSRDEKPPTGPLEDRTSDTNNDIEGGRTTPNPDIPYDNMQPRSRDTLQRAATAAATHRHRLRQPYETDTARREQQVPHESDADNWIPPPPPYNPESDIPLPEYLRRTLLPTGTEPVQSIGIAPQQAHWTSATSVEDRDHYTSSRPLSMFQRLNIITGSRLPSRARRSRRNSEPCPQSRIETSVRHRRRVSSRQPVVLNGLSEHGETTLTPPVHEPMHGAPPSNQIPAANTNHAAGVQESPRLHGDEELAPDDPEWQVFAQAMQNATSGLNFHPFSISSPELHVAEPPEDDTNAAEGEYSTQHAQYQDSLLPTRGMGSLHRRVSTDPTDLRTSPDDSWRRRIEEWNEDTVYQRSKKSRNRCAVM